MIGLPAKRAIGFFGLNRIQLTSKPLKWVTKVSELTVISANFVAYRAAHHHALFLFFFRL